MYVELSHWKKNTEKIFGSVAYAQSSPTFRGWSNAAFDFHILTVPFLLNVCSFAFIEKCTWWKNISNVRNFLAVNSMRKEDVVVTCCWAFYTQSEKKDVQSTTDFLFFSYFFFASFVFVNCCVNCFSFTGFFSSK